MGYAHTMRFLPRALTLALTTGLFLGLAACGDDTGDTGSDAGPTLKDSGFVPLDSGVTDTGTGPVDTGVGQDGGGPVDTGVGQDGGGPVDTGVGQDAGPPDTGIIPDGGVPNSDPLDPATRAAELANAQCTYIQRCQPAVFDFNGDNFAACVADATASLTPIYTAYQGSITGGRMGFSASAFASCTSAFTNADCISGIDIGVCDTATLFQASQPNGGGCVPGECANGWCSTQSLGQCGTCQPYAQSNEDCSNSVCAPGLDCFDVGQANPICLNSNLGQGAQCGTVQTGACRGLYDCLGDPNAGAGTCTAPVNTVGGACDGTGMNAAGPVCNIYNNLNCDPQANTCQTVTWNAAGATCDNGLQLCNGNTFGCDPNTMQCQAAPASGEACVMGECGADLYCEQPATCQPVKGQGTSCAASAECSGNLVCFNGTCQSYQYVNCP